jgi:release factor glutamine methyltransferase
VPTVVEVLRKSQAFLEGKGSPSARLDAELLVADALGLERLEVYLQFDKPLTPDELTALREHIRRRGQREPIATILGQREFWSLPFRVRPGVLVPRPDTEALVEAALGLIPEGECFVADVGAGTGCVGLSVAKERPGVKLYATDMDPVALGLVKENAAALDLADRVAVLKGNLLDPIPSDRPIDVVLSNPPYIPTGEIDGLPPEISQHEPRGALDGGEDGLDVYRQLLPAAAARARIGVAVEVGIHQAEAVADLMRQAGLTDIGTRADLAGIDRVVIGKVG